MAGFSPTPLSSALAGADVLISAAAGMTVNVVNAAANIRINLFTYNLRSSRLLCRGSPL
jgi:hypothetical protein